MPVATSLSNMDSYISHYKLHGYILDKKWLENIFKQCDR